MSTWYYVKQLRLVTPEGAGKVGIPSEAPTFVSPMVDTASSCRVCTVTYTPLVYQTGYETRAHHFHAASGGIYFYVLKQARLYKALLEQTGWMAQVVPLGNMVTSDDGSGAIGRSPAVRCGRIDAWCMCHVHDVYHFTHNRHLGHPIATGQLFAFPHAICGFHLLLPVCDEHDLPPHLAPFRFQTCDGTVYFTQRS
jgi:hypothetical protein